MTDPDLTETEQVAIETRPQVARPKSHVPRKRKKPSDWAQAFTFRFLRGREHKSGKTRFQLVLETLFEQATNPKSGQQKAAAELMLAYGVDKPKPAQDELDAMAKSGFQVVYVERGGLENVPERGVLPEPKPDFLPAEILEDENAR